jgi:gliding motility-associated-like protein
MKPIIFSYRYSVLNNLMPKAKKAFLFLFFPVLLHLSIEADAITGKKNQVLPPVALCKDISIQIGNDGTASITGYDIDAGSYDPDGTITSMIVVPNTFNCSQLGLNTVTLTVTDDEGLSASCNANVIVEDRMSPVILCRNNTIYLDNTGKASITASDINNGSYDNCPGLFLFLSKTDFSCDDIGSPVQITLFGTDVSGNSSSCLSEITVLDTVSPVINVKPYNVIIGSSGTATVLPSDIDNGTFDNCGDVSLSVNPNSFSCGDQGRQKVLFSATDSYGNSSSRNVEIEISSDITITSMALSTCDLAPTFGLFSSDQEGGDGNYSFFWRALNPAVAPFMVILPSPPSIQISNTSTSATPFFNNSIPNGFYDIRLVVTDGNGCADSSEITISRTDPVVNNQTLRYSEACEGEVRTYSVNYESDAVYSWNVINGSILSSETDTNRIIVMWDNGIIQGVVNTTISEPNPLFSGGQCEATVIDSVTINTVPVPVFDNPITNVCSNSITTYTLTGSYAFQQWSVTGGGIISGGGNTDNYVTVWWGTGLLGTVTVSAGNNSLCTGSVLINVTIFNLSGSLTSITDISCNGGSDGSITVEVTAGTGMAPYEFSLDGGPFQPGASFSGISLGNHTVVIRDALLCTFNIPFVINQPPPVTGSVMSVSDVSCFGGSDGSVTISASGGVSPYQYSLNGGAFQGSNIFNGLSAGSYIVTIEDSNDCTGNVPFSIIQPPIPLDGSAAVTNVSCYGESTGRIDLFVTGGTMPFTFLWNNGATSEDLSDIPAGDYNVLITDNNGCTFTVNATVMQPEFPLSGTVMVTNILCFGESTGSINLTVTGGTTPYSFAWNNGAITEDILNIPAGNYSVIITDLNGCITSVNAIVTEPSSAVDAQITSQTNVSCFGGNDGTITITGTGGTAPYEYQIDSGPFQSSGTFGSLTAGLYNITVRDANLCTFVLAVNISEPSSPLDGTIVAQTDVLCFGDATGAITINGSGGTPPYEYSIDGVNFGISGTFTNLLAGEHTFVIRDSNLCTYNLSATITEPSLPLSGSILTQTDVLCYGDATGNVDVTGSGGTPPYAYAIDGGSFQTSGLFENLNSGVHSIIIMDNNLCQFVLPVNISQPSQPLQIDVVHTDVQCMGEATGTASATASGGTAPYTFAWNTIPVQTDPVITGLSAGTYTVTVTDDHGCTVSGSVTISQPSNPLTLAGVVSDVSCFGGLDGKIDLTVTNGTSPLTFLWSNGAITEDIEGLSTGTYSVSVTDLNGCQANADYSVNQPDLLEGSITVTDVICSGESTGSCILTVTGGTLPYTYMWSTGAITKDINNIPAGSYSVSVIDAHGCTINITATVIQPDDPLIGNITAQTNVSVYGGNDGSVTVEASGGTPPYQYGLNSGANQPSGTFSSLSAGSYTVTITDAVLCTTDVIVTITQPQIPLTANIISQTNISCHGEYSGSVTVEGWGGTQPYVYSLDGGPFQDSGVFTSLSAGSYIITVRDTELNLFNIDVIITEIEELFVIVSGTDNVCFGGITGQASAIVTGGTEPYTFEWNTDPVQSTSTATGLSAGTYSVTVTDANECYTTGIITISQPEQEIIVTISTVDVLCSGGTSGSVSALVTGGQEPYLFYWDSTPEQTTSEATDLPAGNYTLTVTDGNGCIITESVEILEPQPLLIQASTISTSCPDSDDGSITLDISGGTAPYDVIWSDNFTTQNRSGLVTGTYTAVVTDQNNCATSVTVAVGSDWSSDCLVIPQIITPNNDGYNDEWRIRNIERYPNAEIRVFNRWGKMVFSTRNPGDNPWDGRSDGVLVPTDSYHYILYLNDGSDPRSGVISVIR